MTAFTSGRALRIFAAASVILNGCFPALWILATAFKSEVELTTKPITYWPQDPTAANFVAAFRDQPLPLYLANSAIVALGATLLSLLLAALAAYAIARLQLKRRGIILAAIVAVSMFPLVTLMVPLFEIMRGVGLLNSYWALIIPYTVLNLPICTLILVSFFQDIPRDLENAAMIDGCTRLGALWRVVIPLSAPGVFTAGILAFVNAWDEFLLALSFNSATAYRTLPVGIQMYQGEFSFPWPTISAALVIAMVPVVIVILIFQERVVSGLTSGGVKG
ncbi:MAG: carbohydrate ABC transporter permease [Betaproteobacteria bacterium]|nr:carbohydrate ABC transporter permease [Betaproteobacteria bacterium]